MNPLQSAIEQRYGPAVTLSPSDAAADQALALLLSHRSVRAWLAQPLPEGAIERLVAAAQSAATSSNLQAWSVVAVEDPARKARLAELAGGQDHVRTAPLLLVWIADLSRLDRAAQSLQLPSDANRYLEQFLVAAIDASLAAQNAVVAAEAMGLGTVYIGGMRNHADAVAAELKLPARAFPLFGLCVGRPDPERPASVKPRLEPAAVLHRETYSTEAEPQAVARYDALLQQFQREQGMTQQPWSLQAARRVAGAGSLSGRDALVDYLKRQGFELL